MALARIVTRTPDQVAFLYAYLRSRGYAVELICPGSQQSLQPELQLPFQGCSREEVLTHDSGATHGANTGRRVIAYDITGRPVEFAEDESEATASSSALAEAGQGLRSACRASAEKLRVYFGHLCELLGEARNSLDEYRTQYLQQRAQAAVKAEEIRRERRAQRQALESERSRRHFEQRHREAQIDAARKHLPVKTRRPQEAVLRAEAAFDHRKHDTHRQPHLYRGDSDLQMAAVTAAVLALLVTLGLGAYRNRLAAPLPANRDLVRSQDVSKPIPVDAAIAPVHPRGSEPAVNMPSGTNLGKASIPLKIDGAVARTAGLAVVRKHLVRRVHRREGEFIAKDEVIIHRRHPSGTAQALSNAGTGPKRISDLD